MQLNQFQTLGTGLFVPFKFDLPNHVITRYAYVIYNEFKDAIQTFGVGLRILFIHSALLTTNIKKMTVWRLSNANWSLWFHM